MFTPRRFQSDGAAKSVPAVLTSVPVSLFCLVALLAWPPPSLLPAAAARQATTVQFTQSSSIVDEAAGGAGLTVTRTGDTSGVVSVDYATLDNAAPVRCDDTTTLPGVAFARCDYATSVDTLTFAPGETVKTLRVPVIDDSFVETPESFQVQLSNLRGGATFGALNTSRVSISSDDGPGKPNPIDTIPFFVRQHYLDFLSREPEATEPWTRILTNCPAGDTRCDRVQVSASFFGSQEFQLKGFFVFRFYKVAFDRLPDYTEIVRDMRRVTGQTAAEVFQERADYANAFVRRQEFVNLYGGLGDQEYVAALLGRYGLTQVTTPDPQQPDGANKVVLTGAQLAERLGAGTLTRAQVLRAVVQSDEVSAAEFNEAFVAMQYYGYLRRNPDAGGFQMWLDFLRANPNDFRTMVRGFLESTEYRLRFGNN